MSYCRVTVRLCLDGKLEEKCFDEVKELVEDSRWLKVVRTDGKTYVDFNKKYVYEVITEVMG